MVKKCFVIMPFSRTQSHSEEEWTHIYESLFKRIFEDAGYECERASTTRGGAIIGDIIRQLDTADIVLADLTDNKANVLYELGIRHTLGGKCKNTIMVAQKREDLPSDLSGYGVIFYSPLCIDDFKRKINDRIKEIERNPDKSDNPVSDFLDKEREGYIEQLSRSYRKINHKQIFSYIKEAGEIWVMNPLYPLSIIKKPIVESIRINNCKRKYIISDAELDLYLTYLERLREDIGVIVDELFELIPMNAKFIFPLSFVICNPFNRDARVWIQPEKSPSLKEMYGLYTEDKETVKQFVGTFTAFKNLLTKRGRG